MTLEDLLVRLAEERTRSNGYVDIQTFVGTFYPRDFEVAAMLQSAFSEGLVRGQATFGAFHTTGYISEVTALA